MSASYHLSTHNREPYDTTASYHPPHQVRITKEGMEKLGDITIFVLDYDPTGADNLGFFKLGLDQVRVKVRVRVRVRVRVN